MSGAKLAKALSRLGFQVVRIKGNHHFMRHPEGRCTVIPIHRGDTIGPGLLAQILRDCDIDRDALRRVL